MDSSTKIGILGAGAMGSGIAQVAATAGHQVVLFDTQTGALNQSKSKLANIMARLVEKKRITDAESYAIQGRIAYTDNIEAFAGCGLLIEAIVESLDIKKKAFAELEKVCGNQAILATNTSSLSVASIAAACRHPERVLGIHFFNPAPLMPLVEIVPAVQTGKAILRASRELIDNWGKVTVLAKDTPGFIVNRVARPFYGEALRIYEEGIADFSTIDWAMRELGGFRMGPFQLMDFIGNDVNYKVTESVFSAFYYDPRYKPSFTQKRHAEAGYLGRKSGRGYYDYSEGAMVPAPNTDEAIGYAVLHRILVMLINEAADALYLNIATREDLDLAMTKGVNYPKGLLKWADELGIDVVLNRMEDLYGEYGEDRYRPSPMLRRMVRRNKKFWD